MTAPKDTASAYPNSPPSWIDPGVSALMWLPAVSLGCHVNLSEVAWPTLETRPARKT